MKLLDLYQNSVDCLRGAHIPDARLEVSILLGHLLHIPRAKLFFNDLVLIPETLDKFEGLLKRRLQREPLSYILGDHEFWSLPFKVTPDVLIPRPETEILVEIGLQIVKREGDEFNGRILDMGTGSGVIAVVLALELPFSQVFALDKSHAALQVVSHNRFLHQVHNRLHLLQSDWLAAIREQPMFDLITANPPYVAHEDFVSLQPEIDFEPRLALDGGHQGMEEIKRLAVQIQHVLKPGGWFLMEIGSDQADLVMNCFSERYFDNLNVHKDYAGLSRIFQARRSSQGVKNG